MVNKPKERKALSSSGIVSEASRVSLEMSLAKAIRETAHWKRKYTGAMDSALAAEGQLGALLDIQGAPAIKKFPKSRPPKPAGVAVVVPATDWHVEERISLKATNGKNEFDLEEAETRIQRFYRKVLRLIAWQNHLSPVTELWHPLLGDLMTGYIHEDLVETNSCSPTEACVFLQEMICSGIEFWLKETKLPIFVPTCVGNHGRTTQRKRIKTSTRNSYEWLLYKTLEKQFRKNSRVFFQVGDGYHNVQIIMGRKVRFHHGDGLRYQGGVGGISIPVNKAVAAWDRVEAVDFDIFGHWHQFLAHYPKWVSCGSLMGYTEYALEIKAEYQAPTQTFIVIDRDYGMVSALPIWLTPSARRIREEAE